jgi:cysteinyl-tRNA synthetase
VSTRIESGISVPLQQWRDRAEATGPKAASLVTAERQARGDAEPEPFLADLEGCQRHFDDALASGDARGAVKAALELEALMTEWAHETFSADERDRARSALRAMVTRLGETAESGLRDPREVLTPFVDALLEARERARKEERFDDADAIRDRLVDAGIEVHDRPDGTGWEVGGLT